MHAALALANLSLYSSPEAKKKIIQKKVNELAFYLYCYSYLIGSSSSLPNKTTSPDITLVSPSALWEALKRWRRPLTNRVPWHWWNHFFWDINQCPLPVMTTNTHREDQKNGSKCELLHQNLSKQKNSQKRNLFLQKKVPEKTFATECQNSA